MKNSPRSQAESLIDILTQLLDLEDIETVFSAALVGVENFPRFPELWRLLGVSSGALGNHQVAAISFAVSLHLEFDDITAANFMAGLLADGKYIFACSAANQLFPLMTATAQKLLIKSFTTALLAGHIAPNNLSRQIQFGLWESRS